jgi:protein-disulfide isomerase
MQQVPDLRRQRRWQLGGLTVVLVAVAALAIAVAGSHSSPPLRPGAPIPGAARVASLFAGVTQHGPTLGDVHAPVALIEFADLQCPVCAAFARDALPTLVAREVRAGRLLIVFRALHYIGPDSVRAARMALAVGRQNRLWQFIDLFYVNQRDENSGYVSDRLLTALSDAIPGVDSGVALRARGGGDVTRTLLATAAEARRRGLQSTPAFLLGRSGGPLHSFTPPDLSAASFTSAVERVATAAQRSGA